MKCIMIINDTLPRGIIANTTAALGISISSIKDGMTGAKVIDGSNRTHEGITNTPIPILSLEEDKIKALYDTLLEEKDPELKVIGFNDVAQQSHHYEDYQERIKNVSMDNLGYLGICVLGPKKKVSRLSGQLKMLR